MCLARALTVEEGDNLHLVGAFSFGEDTTARGRARQALCCPSSRPLPEA